MTEFGMYGGKKFQDKIRTKLLALLDAMIRGDEGGTVTMAGMYASIFYDGMSPFKDQLDLHNRCLLANVKYQSDNIFRELHSRVNRESRDRKSGDEKHGVL
jgi:hypothetical protein